MPYKAKFYDMTVYKLQHQNSFYHSKIVSRVYKSKSKYNFTTINCIGFTSGYYTFLYFNLRMVPYSTWQNPNTLFFNWKMFFFFRNLYYIWKQDYIL